MQIGFIGLGKLGYPVALTMALKGHDVKGYDVNKPKFPWPHQELGLGCDDINEHEQLVQIAGHQEVVDHAELLFVAVQTPHAPECEGTSLSPEPQDFDYGYLRQAWNELERAVTKPTRVAIISTVLPGTIATLPRQNKLIQLAYNPFFIAMGTVMRDFANPEFVLNGGVDLSDFYATITNAPVIRMGIESAELTKVLYNTFIGFKIAYANLAGEICHKTDANVDEVMGALKCAYQRLISPSYLDAGMGDGGGCHPRDNLALSWLAGQLSLHYNLFDALVQAREEHAWWLASLMGGDLPKLILGTAFKPGTRITTGSHALLVNELAKAETAETYEPNGPQCILIGCRNPEYAKVQFAKGCKVIDPFRYIPDQEGVEVVRIGE